MKTTDEGETLEARLARIDAQLEEIRTHLAALEKTGDHDLWLKTKQAAEYLSLSISTLNNSRIHGVLLGIEAPPYTKTGKYVRYKLSDLNEWRSRLKQQRSNK